MQNMTESYIRQLCIEAQHNSAFLGSASSSANGANSGKINRIDRDSFLYSIRKDGLKLNRIKNLLDANEKIKVVQKVELTDSS